MNTTSTRSPAMTCRDIVPPQPSASSSACAATTRTFLLIELIPSGRCPALDRHLQPPADQGLKVLRFQPEARANTPDIAAPNHRTSRQVPHEIYGSAKNLADRKSTRLNSSH